MPPGSPDGPILDLFGQCPAPASRSARRESEPELTMIGICGPTRFASSEAIAPSGSVVNRFQERLATVGSTECSLIWRAKRTPAKRLMLRLAASTRPISETASHGPRKEWPSQTLANATGGQSSRSGDWKDEPLLGGLMREAMWSTPTVIDAEGRGYQRDGRTGKASLTLPGQMDETRAPPEARDRSAPWPTVTSLSFDQSHQPGTCRTMEKTRELMEGATWSTPRASDGEKGAPLQEFSGGGTPLPAQMYANDSVSTRSTPKASIAGPDCAKMDRSSTGLSLQTQMAAVPDTGSPWASPSARDWKDSAGMSTEGEEIRREDATLFEPEMAINRQRTDQLPRQMVAAQTWPTPDAAAMNHGPDPTANIARRARLKEKKINGNGAGTTLGAALVETEHFGPAPSGSIATTEKRGAPNPEFAFWLMSLNRDFFCACVIGIATQRILKASRKRTASKTRKSASRSGA